MNEAPESPAFLQKTDRVLDLFSKICLILAGTALVAMTVMFAWLVYGRYVLNDTPTWVEQVSHLLIMVIAFLGAAVGVRQDTHLSVVLFRSAVPSRIRTVFVFITDVLMAGFGGFMFWYGLELTMFKWKTLIPLIQWSEGLRSLPLTICGALIFLFSISHLVRLLRGQDERKDTIE
uniref:TRAP transporter small permease protein n=1 Tax=uncultured Thiotrichaceae bacterium TaxID=298394 RepID=A0A6S6T237_9GAMM|nr:MAG: C4-dicarboxylate ABC transporter permease [uncultured Thiotrichaceae bacterium]